MRAHSHTNLPGAATARARVETPVTVNVPLFRSLIQMLAEDRRWVVLDLGAARPQTVELLNRYRCRLDIANFSEAADTLADADDSVQPMNRAEALLPAHHAEPTDMVFCWDFLNYLNRSALTALMAITAARCRPGAFVHALIVYSEPLMQQQPGQFAPVDDGHLQNLSAGKPARIAPRYSPDDLHTCMPNFTIERVRLLSNGMQEYLFRV